MRKSFWVLVVLFTAIFTLSFPRPAHAYLDPTTTNSLLQIFSLVFYGSLAVLTLFYRRIKLFFQSLRDKLSAKK